MSSYPVNGETDQGGTRRPQGNSETSGTDPDYRIGRDNRWEGMAQAKPEHRARRSISVLRRTSPYRVSGPSGPPGFGPAVTMGPLFAFRH